MSEPTRLQHQILDLLVDGSSSFAAVYSAVNRLYSPAGTPLGRRIGVRDLWDAIADLEKAGFVKIGLMTQAEGWRGASEVDRARARRHYEKWLPTASYEEMSLDEVSLWIQIEPRGRLEWKIWANAAEGLPRRWMLDEDAETTTITVLAEDAITAEKALQEWLANHPRAAIVLDSPTVQPVDSFQLRDGSMVNGGVKLFVKYRVETIF